LESTISVAVGYCGQENKHSGFKAPRDQEMSIEGSLLKSSNTVPRNVK